jgi:site-specific DNA-cytosine methylase
MDCSGLTAPILAMRAMGFSAEQVFSSEVVEYKRDFVRLNAPGAALCEDMSRRDHGSMPACDFYVCGFPCKPWPSFHSRTNFSGGRVRRCSSRP